MTKICLHCSTPLNVDDKFCGECGEKVVDQSSGTHPSFSTAILLKSIALVSVISFVWVWFFTHIDFTDLDLLSIITIAILDKYPDTSFLLMTIYQYMFLVIPPIFIFWFIQKLLQQQGHPLFLHGLQIILYLVPFTILLTIFLIGWVL